MASRNRSEEMVRLSPRPSITGFAALLLLFTFVVVAAGFSIYQIQLQRVQSDTRRALDAAVAGLTGVTQAADDAMLKSLAARIFDAPQAERVVITGTDSRIRVDSNRRNEQRENSSDESSLIPHGISAFSLSRPVVHAGTEVGTVTVDYNVRLLRTTFSWIVLMGAILMCASLLLTWYGYRKLCNAVTIPINAIERVRDEITRTGNLSHRLPSAGGDDTGGIEVTVNKLLNQLDEQEKKRALYRSHLEREVNKRTAALAASNERLNKLAYLSVETQLPNRAAFLNRLHQLCSMPRDDGKVVGLFVIRISLVRYANEAFGFDVGDMIIESAARALVSMQPPDSNLFHLGGGEFASVQVDQAELMHGRALDILGVDELPFTYQGATLHLQPKVGFALHPVDATSVDDLTRFSMLALNVVTGSESRSSVVRYQPALLADTVSMRQLEMAIKNAIDSGQFEPYFQSRVNTQTGQVHGLEALVRWTSPELEGHSNYQLIPIAERSLLITELDSEMLRKVMEWLGILALEGIRIPVAVNLSARTLQRASLPDEIAALVAFHGLRMEQIELELTETVLIDQSDVLRRNLSLFRDMGISLLLDDFGSGYSSLRYLYELPISTVKIDALFVRGLPNDPTSLAIVESTINLAHRLGKRVVAEGVESYAQWELLASMGCDEVQGYFLMRPQRSDVVADMLRKQFDTSVGRLTIDLTSLAHTDDFPWSGTDAVRAC